MSGIFHHLLAFVTSAVTDPFWKYVTLLLHGNGTNGAQNNTFIDSSSNAFTVTRNGSATQGSFSPFGPDWSNQFSSANLSLATATALGTGNTTVEFWFFPTDSSATYRAIYDGRSTVNTDTGYAIFQYGLTIEVYGNGLKVATAASAFLANTWIHVALVRTSGACQIYINGVASGSSGTYSNNLTSTVRKISDSVNTSFPFVGYISNLREVTSALYSGTFTPSTTPLTAITGTVLLTCQSNRFIDNSTNAFAITVNGTPSIQRFSPFSMGSAYSTSVIGGSGYYNGTTDYLSVPDNAALQFGTGDFTIELWFYPTSSITSQIFCGKGTGADGFELRTRSSAGGNVYSFWLANGSAAYVTSSQVVTLNTWQHLAVVRSGTTMTLYYNGVSVGTTTGATNNFVASGSGLAVGTSASSSGIYANGYISNFRVVKGVAVYTGTFTPPTTPLAATQSSGTNISAITGTQTSVLLSTINGGIYDNAMMNNLITVGNAQVSTTQSKFGGASMAFDGSGDWLTAIDTPNLQLGSGNFTIEGWVYLNAIGVAYGLISKGTSSTGWSINVTSGNKLQFSYTASNLTGATSLAASTWYYFAVVRSGTATGNVKIYLNGTADATSGSAITDNFNQTSTLYVGADRVGGSSLNGYIDDLRLTTGYARTITTPTAAFPNY
jgi:hypothetical protein